MVKVIKSSVIFAFCFLLAGCVTPEFHTYTRSLSKSYSGNVEVLPIEAFQGSYQATSNYDGADRGTLTISPNSCLGIKRGGVIDTNADCETSHVMKFSHILRIGDRLFVETLVRTKLYRNYRYILFEMIVSKDKFNLIQMVYDTQKLFDNKLDFSRTTSGDAIHLEVQNGDMQTNALLASMKRVDKYNSITSTAFRPMTMRQNRELRELLSEKGIMIQKDLFAPETCNTELEERQTGVQEVGG